MRIRRSAIRFLTNTLYPDMVFMDQSSCDNKYEALKRQIEIRGSMLIAFSGGLDSSLLAAVATKVLGKNVHCIFIDSPLVPRASVSEARRIAHELGLTLEIVRNTNLDDDVRRNPPDRCFYCRKADAKILKRRARELGLSCVADGINLSDQGEHRPGIAASSEEGIIHPFIDAGITKDDIRSIAREMGFDFWNKPSDACLASRFPYGEEIVEDNLKKVEKGEEYLHSIGFRVARVRLHAGIARIEVEPKDIARIVTMSREIVQKFRALGFSYITLDLEGYRSGSMDEVLR